MRAPRVSTFGALPVAFIENRGQLDPRLAFYVWNGGQTLGLTNEGIVFQFRRAKVGSDQPGPKVPLDPGRLSRPWERAPVEMEQLGLAQDLIGASKDVRIDASRPLPGTYNYFLGKDPALWRTGVKSYAEVAYRDVWEGIDLRLAANGAALEQEFVVRAGADPGRIRVAYRGAEGLEVAADGSLLIKTAFGTLRESAPRIYQEIGGKRVAVEGRFKLLGATTYTFEVGAYEPHYALVIDPTLFYSVTVGGGTQGLALAVDAAGNIYVTGNTEAAPSAIPNATALKPVSLPCTAGLDLFGDAYVMKVDPLGNLVYFTFVSGSCGDVATGIAVDPDGSAYMTGQTNSLDFPTTPGAFMPNNPSGTSGGCDIFECFPIYNSFVAKLNASGSSLAYSTYLGGRDATLADPSVRRRQTFAQAIAVDHAGQAYVAGETYSSDFATAGAIQTSNPMDKLTGFVVKLSSGGSLGYATFLGGTTPNPGTDTALGIAADQIGNVYVTGVTTSSDFPTTAGAFQRVLPSTAVAGAFVTKIDPTGASLIYSTYLTGSTSAIGQGTSGSAIGIDAHGSAYVTGYTWHSDFPATPGAFQTSSPDPNVSHAFVAKLSADATRLGYSTYLGGASSQYYPLGTYQDVAYAIAVDASGNASITGSTLSYTFPTTPDAFQLHATPGTGNFNSEREGFVTVLNPTGSTLIYSTYLGSDGDDVGRGIGVDAAGNTVVVGTTTAINGITGPITTFPVTQAIASVNFSPAAFAVKFATGFQLLQILPTAGGNAGSVTITFQGAGFKPGTTVKLTHAGQQDISPTQVIASSDRAITATFDLSGWAVGARNAVVTNPDGTLITLPGAFTIVSGGAPNVWVDIVGPSALRAGTPTGFYIVYGNSGSIDANGLMMQMQVPPSVSVSTKLPFLTGDGGTSVFFEVPPLAPSVAKTIPIALTVPLGFSGALHLSWSTAPVLPVQDTATIATELIETTPDFASFVFQVIDGTTTGAVSVVHSSSAISGPVDPTATFTDSGGQVHVEIQFSANSVSLAANAVEAKNTAYHPSRRAHSSIEPSTAGGAVEVLKTITVDGRDLQYARWSVHHASTEVDAAVTTAMTRIQCTDWLTQNGYITPDQATRLLVDANVSLNYYAFTTFGALAICSAVGLSSFGKWGGL